MSVSLSDSHARLCEAERRLDLLRYSADGWAAWPLVRFEASIRLSAVSHPGAQVTGRAARVVRVFADLPSLLAPRSAGHLIKTYSSGLAEQDGDRYTDVWFDDIVAAVGSTFKIEALNNVDFARRSRRARTPKDLSSASLEVLAGVLARRPPAPDVERASVELARALRDDIGLAGVDTRWVRARLQHFVAAKRIYRWLLARVRPRVVLVAESTEHALVAAAREHGARVFELQHGVSDRSHAGYSWTDYAVPYRPVMPVPDRLLLHGEHWKREVAGGGFWEGALSVVGSPRMDRYRQEAARRPPDGPFVVATTQGFEVDRVAGFLRAFLESLPPGSPVRLAVKLHPLYDTDPARYVDALSAFRDRATVVAGHAEPSTFQLLSRAHLHVSIASASHYDAIGLGVPTVILPFETHEVVLPLREAGHASFARTPQELAALAARWRDLRLPGDVGEYYFRSGALENILRELHRPG